MAKDNFNDAIKFYDRLYKGAILFALIFIMIGVVVGVREVYLTIQRVDDSTQKIQQNIACIVSIFAQPNRQQVTVDNINKCILIRK